MVETRLPTQYDLPWEDGIPMEDGLHVTQAQLLMNPLQLYWEDRGDFEVGSNQFLYYSLAQRYQNDFVGLDFYLAVDLPADRDPVHCWVVWEQNKPPDLVIEILSPTTAHRDKTAKKQIYQDDVRVPEYYWHDLYANDLAGFTLRNGIYQPIVPDENGLLHSAVTGLALTRVEVDLNGTLVRWLRWATPDGRLLPTSRELAQQETRRAEQETRRAEQETRRAEQETRRAEQETRRADLAMQQAERERQQAEQERQQADHERQRAERLAARLRELGIDPDA